MGGGSNRYHRFQPRLLAGWLGGLAADDECHHFPGGDSGGVGGEMHPVPSPDAGPVDGGQFLRIRLERTKKFQNVEDPDLCCPFAGCGGLSEKLFRSG
jgi:hypothetical protein